MDLSSFFLVIRNMETDSRSIFKVALSLPTYTSSSSSILSDYEYSFNSPRLDRPHTNAEKCCCWYPFIPRGHTHTDLTKKGTMYLTTASFFFFQKKKVLTKAKNKKKGLSRGTISLSLSASDCFSMCWPMAAYRGPLLVPTVKTE